MRGGNAMQQLNIAIDRSQISNEVEFKMEEVKLPEKVIQIGEGNFMRGFVDWMIHQMNNQGLFNGKVVAVQPTPHGKVVPKLLTQDCLYTVSLRGIQAGKRVEKNEIITAISRAINPYSHWGDILALAESPQLEFMLSNTTEAGITYYKENYNYKESPLSFPGKVTAILYHRYLAFEDKAKSGLTIIPCELIENNGERLRELVLQYASDWNLPQEFIDWVNEHNKFCNTLVDRIVTGYPKDELDHYSKTLQYEDSLLTTGEPYHMFAIEADEDIAEKIPFHKAGLNVKWGDVTPYRELKVRLLNGPHTMMFAVCYLSGVDTVLEAMTDETLRSFIEQGINEEIFPMVNMEKQEKEAFVTSVIERFLNPYNKHFLTDIGMNAVYKFKSRLLPTLQEYVSQNQKLPDAIVFSLAALFTYYRPLRVEGDFLIGKRGEQEYTIRDNPDVLLQFSRAWNKVDSNESSIETMVTEILANQELWGIDLNLIPDLTQTVTTDVNHIVNNGMRVTVMKKMKQVTR